MPNTLPERAVGLLKKLIATPSLSREEADTAHLIYQFLETTGVAAQRQGNNIWAQNRNWKEKAKPTSSLTPITIRSNQPKAGSVIPSTRAWKGISFSGWEVTMPVARLVSLIATFLHFYEQELPFNLILAATAEEEISGPNGIASLLPTPRPH